VRERLKTAKGRIRKMGADFLAYALIDSIVDRYFIVLESIGERFEDVEDEVVTVPDRSTLLDIYTLKREMLFLRQSVWPMREAVSVLERMDSPLIADNTKIYLRDVYDHTIQVIDNIETYRDMSASLLDTYLSSLSNKLNEIIKVLTVMSTVFIPMTFLTGLFGMNVAYMVKALEYNWAFPMILIMMLAIALTMLTYFKKRGWF
jgi:magnesium transporter